MDKKKTYTLSKIERLKSRKAIEHLFAKGITFSVFPLRVIYTYANTDTNANLKAGFSASAKHFKKAVDRNRIKRLQREAYRLQKNELNGLVITNKKALNIFFIYTGNELPDYKLIFEKMGRALLRLQKEINEQPEINN